MLQEMADSVEHDTDVECINLVPKSNVLHREHRYSTMEIFPILLNVERDMESIKVRPSSFNHEMQMSTEERLRKLANPLRKCDVLHGQQTSPPRYFKPSPRIIIFQNFTPGKVYSTSLNIRNSYEALQSISMNCEESHYFSVKYGPDSHTRVAPGMAITIIVQFKPEEKHDYSYQVSFSSESESFVVPIIALAPRPMLDFPDDITIPPSPVKICNTKILVVRNISEIPAVFSLIAESPFSVEPLKGVLRAGELMHVNISVQTTKVGDFNGSLIIKYETDELLYSNLHAITENINVYIEKGSITMEETFLGLKRQHTVKIHNDSDHIIQFKWKKMASTDEELCAANKLTHVFGTLKDIETRKSVKLDILNIIDPVSHAVVYDRIYDDEVKALKNEDFLFIHSSFSLFPISGEVWPQSWVDILVIFEPDRALTHTAKAYCDVSGCEDRIPLEITGIGAGPRLAFNLDSLDIGSIFLNTTHCYEVVITNSGLISGTILYLPSELKYGGELTCVPESHSLIVEGYATFVISFSSSVQGQFVEELLFQVHESDDILRIEFKGNIVSPVIHFDIKILELGDVSIGFLSSYNVLLTNPSMIPVPFSLKMRGDGTEPSLTYKMYAALKEKRSLPIYPNEFIIEPSRGIVEAYSSLIIKVTLIPNVCRTREIVLSAEMVEYKSESILLPISYSAQYPSIESTTTDISIRFCFINYPYTRTITLENSGSLPGFFSIIPQQVTSYTTMTFSTSVSEGVLKAQSKMKIPLTIMTNSLGKQSLSISLMVLGEDKPKLCCNLVCNGQGPVVSVNPHHLMYGAIKLLEPAVLELTITNDSPVPADFMASIGKPKSPWSISPEKGVLYAEETATLNVSVYLTDTGIYKDVVLLQVHNSRNLTVNMSAEGIGTSLVLDPPICPIYEMGSLFSRTLIQREFTITNEGSRHHQLVWSSLREIKEFSRATVDIVSNTIFHIVPMKLDISGGHTVTLVLEGQSDSVQTVSEQFYCHAIIDNGGKKQTLLTSKITASFVEPKVTFSKSEISFRIDIGPGDCFSLLQDTIEITSMIDLPHNINFKIDSPFMLLGENDELLSDLCVELESLGKISVTIVFDPSYKTDYHSRFAKGFLYVYYKEHPHVDSVAVYGEVNFPNLIPVPNILKFGTIPVGSEAVKEFHLNNLSPLPISYSWHWQDECTKIEFPEPVKDIMADEFISPVIPSEGTEEPVSSENTWAGDDMDMDMPEVVVTVTTFNSEPDIPAETTSIPVETTDMLAKTTDRTDLPGLMTPDLTVHVNTQTSLPPEPNSSQMLKDRMFPLVVEFFQEETEMSALELLPAKREKSTIINKLFDITPFYGKLDPYEMQIITVSFNGYSYVSAEAVAECIVEGGPVEKLKVIGRASNICYHLSKLNIDFGPQLFCVPCSDTFTLYNMGPLSFDFQIDTPDSVSVGHFVPGMLSVTPRSGHIEGHDMVELTVQYFPGMSSGFKEFFHIEIGYLDTIEIQVTGSGVFPQLHIYLPRPSMCSLSPQIGYKAIASLAPHCFTARKTFRAHGISTDTNHSHIMIPDRDIRKLKQKQWVIISYEDILPSIADIDLAIERILAYQFVEDNPYIVIHLSSQLKIKSIPQFIVPPYEIDLGVVVLETTVSFSALIYNFGPSAVDATLSYTNKKSFLKEKGLFITFHDIVGLPADQTSAIQVLFNPMKSNYSAQKHEFHYILYLEIVNGANIPIFIHGIVTVPCLKLSTDVICFESVRCGECKGISFILRNEGLVPCKWTGILQNKPKKGCKKKITKLPILTTLTEDEPKPEFAFKYTQNYLMPKQETYVDVYFQPNTEGLKKMTLVITIEKNEEKLHVKLKGVGLEPTLLILDSCLEFDPVLPYPQNEEKLFTVINPCPFTVEVVFPDFDSQILEEERILRILCHYYESDHVFLPVRTAGEKLSSVFTDFYNNLAEEVVNKLNQEKEREDSLHAIEEELSEERRSKRKIGGAKIHATISQTICSVPQAVIDTGSSRTPDEMEQLIHEYIKELHQLENFSSSDVNPIQMAFSSKSPEVTDNSSKDGILIVFHGAPYTDYIHTAHKAARALDLTVLNIDQVILEAAASSYTVEGMMVRDYLKASYMGLILGAQGDHEENKEDEEDGEDNTSSELVVMEELTKMTEELVIQMHMMKPFPVTNSKPIKKVDQKLSTFKTSSSVPSSQHSNRQAKRSPVIDDLSQNVTLAGIPLDILQDVLKKRFHMRDCRGGVVIDSLSSMFFINTSVTLTTLLRAAGNIEYIHCIILTNSYITYSNWLANKKTSEEEEATAKYIAKLERFKTLSDEDAAVLSMDDHKLYLEIMLNQRRQRLKLKKELSLKKQQEMLQQEQLKKAKQQSKKPHKKGQTESAKKHRNASTPRPDPEVLVTKTSPESDELRKKSKHKSNGIKMLSSLPEGGQKKSSKRQGTNRTSSHKSKNKESVVPEETLTMIMLQFEEFENDYLELLPILENWDKKKGIVMNMSPEKAIAGQHPKGKTPRRSRRPSIALAHSKLSTSPDVLTYRKSSEALQETLPSGEKIDHGLPVWLVDCRDPNKPKNDIIINLLTTCTQLVDSRLDIEELDRLKPNEPISFDFVSIPKRREKAVMSDNTFILCSADIQEVESVGQVESSEDTTDLPDKSVTSSLRGRNVRRKRKKSLDLLLSTKKEKKSLYSITELTTAATPKLKSRWILAPLEKLQFKIRFEPQAVGEYTQIYNLEIMGWNTTYQVTGQGLCDLPRIDMDPRVLFPNVADSTDSSNVTRFTHFINKNIFDFGAVLVAKLKEKRLHDVVTTFNISNCSTLVAEVQFGFLDKITEKVDAFGFEPNIITVEPGCSQPLTVYASPHLLGSITETLVCSIKNNPVLEFIKIKCQGIKVDFEVDTKVISFDHMLLYRKESRILTLINKCLVPLLWRFAGTDQFQEDFIISDTAGLILPLDKYKVTFDYSADKVQSIAKKSLRLEVYDENGRGDPVHTEIIMVNAETIDVMLDLIFAIQNEHHVSFGKVKVGHEYKQSLQLRNRGKYDLIYKIVVHKPQRLPIPNLQQMVSVSPITGTVPHGEKLFNVIVMCTPMFEFNVTSEPLLKCYIMDRTNVVAIIPINFSITSFYSRYNISPTIDINFGALTVGTRKTLDLNIENFGLFDFKYNISKFVKDNEEDTKMKGSGDAKKMPGSKRTMDKLDSKISSGRAKIKRLDSLSVGLFTITTSSGTVLPDQIACIHIDCVADYEGTFSEEILVNISESSPDNKLGTTIQLLAIVCMPAVDFTDVESIFQEHYICQSITEFRCPFEVGNHCVYVKDEGKLMFCRVCIGTKGTARLRLRNPGLISCEVNVAIIPIKGAKATDSIFSVSPAKLYIQPHSLEMVEVTFSPMLIETYSSTLELTMDMPLPNKTTRLLLKLGGEGCMPMITLICPVVSMKGGYASLVFRPMLLNQSSTLKLIFQNTGIILCKVIVEITRNVDNFFSLHPQEDTIPLLRVWTPDEPMKRSTVVTLAPTQSASFWVTFEPREAGRFQGEVKLFVVDNPFENFSIILHGESYMEDIAFDNLPMLYWSRKSKLDVQDPGTAQHHLDFGMCYVNKSKKISFKITNHSKIETYRFEWEQQPNIVLSPNIGHLKPGETKETLATFLSSSPLEFTKVIDCLVVKLAYPKGNPGTCSWDDRLMVVRWIPENDTEEDRPLSQSYSETMKHKVIEPKNEPEYKMIDGSNRTIPVLVTSVVGYASFYCEIERIDFADTLMFQNRIFELRFKNTGSVPLDYCWTLSMDEHYPIRPSSSTVLQAMESLVEPTSAQPSQPASSIPSVEHRSLVNLPLSKSRKRLHSGSNAYAETCQLPDRECLEAIPESSGIVSASLREELFSSSADISDRSNDSWMETDYIPFQVHPECGILQPNANGVCTVSFAPLDVFNYKTFLSCRILHLNPNQTTKQIIVTARSLMPFCHFDVEESDYITSGRRDPSRPGSLGQNSCLPLDPDTKTIEFKVLGIGDTHYKTFKLINPTEVNYTFSWHNTSVPNPNTVSAFHCATLDGFVASGKQTEVTFSFLAHDVGTFETFWNFCILEHNIEIPFLLVATVTAPAVSFLTSHIHLCPTLLGIPTIKNVMLVNSEDIPLKFNFLTDSLFSEGCQQQLKLHPLMGVLTPNSQIPIKLEFTPSLSGEANFQPKCIVKSLKKPLELNVVGECYSVQPIVTYEYDKSAVNALNPNKTTIIDLGELHPRKMETVIFRVTNIGKPSFYYYWKYDEECMKKNKLKINFLERGGHVTSQSRIVCTMSVTVTNKTTIKDFSITLQISRGPQYLILLQGEAVQPSFRFSFYSHNFGVCLFKPTVLCQYNTQLHITNHEDTPIVVDCFFINQPHLTVDAASGSIPPKQTIDVPITFHPRARSKYEDTIEFILNGTFKKTVTILGEGAHIKVELVNPHHKTVSLGALHVGESKIFYIPVINKSKAPVNVLFDLAQQSSTQDCNSSELERAVTFNSGIGTLKVLPSSPVLLKPNGTVELTVHFSPTMRIKHFTEKISMMILEEMVPLCIITGSCIGAEFSLDRNYLPFGAVVEGCSSTLKFILMNTGDIGARFHWPAETSDNYFSITPYEGYCSPGTEVNFSIEFHPIQLQENIRTEVICNIENYKSLTLTLTGSCIVLPQPKDVVMFTASVRQEDKKAIVLTNKSGIDWNLFPIISGEYFSGCVNIHVPAYGTEQYEIVYSPLDMTLLNKHNGSVFFRVPEGQGLLYQLVGTAEPPIVNSKISREIPYKTKHTELLLVNNWLKVSQRFHVNTEVMKTEKFDPIYSIQGNEYIDVPGKSEREYRLNFYSYRECSLTFKVTFRNEESNEYQYYELMIRVVKCALLDTIKIKTCVRHLATYQLQLENPLTSSVNYNISCTVPDIQLPSTIVVLGETKILVIMEYLPISPGEFSGRLEASCTELGTFPYELKLTALPPLAEKPLYCTVRLGASAVIEALVHNVTRAKADFACKTDNPMFHVEKLFSVQPNSKGNVEVIFEPTSLGNTQTTLSVTSVTAGEFIFSLIGTCLVPKPQGPLLLKPGSTINIPFRNIFSTTKTFNVDVDDPLFIPRNASETIKSKKEHRIQVSLASVKNLEVSDLKFPVTGKLLITCADPKLSNITWTYYLKAILE